VILGRWRRLGHWLMHSLAGRVSRAIALVAAVLGIVAAAVQFWPLLHPDGPTLMSGDLNLAIAGFAGPGRSAVDGRLLSASVTRSLEASLERQ